MSQPCKLTSITSIIVIPTWSHFVRTVRSASLGNIKKTGSATHRIGKPWLVCDHCRFLELALQAAAQDCISPSSPAPSIDGSREQLVKRDKVMFWVLSPSNLPRAAQQSAGSTMIEAREAKSRLKKAEPLTTFTAHTNTLNWWGPHSLWFRGWIMYVGFDFGQQGTLFQNYVLIVLFLHLKHWWSL